MPDTSRRAMPRRRWGKTGLSIPVVPCGTQAFGDAFRKHTLDEAFAIIRHCVDVGINHFDTSRCYSGSLPRLGEAIRQKVVKRDEVILTGRVCRHGNDVDYSRDATVRWVEEDMTGLAVDYLDAVLIHDPIEMEQVLAAGGTLDGLLALKEQKIIGAIGLGANPHRQHLAAIETGKVDVLLTFNDYNLLRQTASEELLPLAASLDMGVLNGWSIVRGILTGEDVNTAAERGGWAGQADDIAHAKRIRAWCNANGVNMLALALQFCLRDERIHGNPVAFTTIEEINAAVEAVTAPMPETVWQAFAELG